MLSRGIGSYDNTYAEVPNLASTVCSDLCSDQGVRIHPRLNRQRSTGLVHHTAEEPHKPFQGPDGFCLLSRDGCDVHRDSTAASSWPNANRCFPLRTWDTIARHVGISDVTSYEIALQRIGSSNDTNAEMPN